MVDHDIKRKILERVQSICESQDCILDYLCLHGSHLYGLASENSDLDVVGIFHQPLKSLMLHEKKMEITQKEDDLDIKLFSIQYLLRTLLKKGESTGVDILFSPTNSGAVIYTTPFVVNNIFKNYERLIDPRKTTYLPFATSQVTQYRRRSENYNVYNKIIKFLESSDISPYINGNMKLKKIDHQIVELVGDKYICNYKFISPNGYKPDIMTQETIQQNATFLYLLNAEHERNISLKEFHKRVKLNLEKYGERTKRTSQLNGKDYKALYSAMRAYYQSKSLLTIGNIVFPFRDLQRTELKSIKEGNVDFYRYIDFLEKNGLEDLKKLETQFDKKMYHSDELCKNIIFSLYGYS